VTYAYFVCNALIDDMRKVMDTAFKEKVMELAMDPLQLQQNFNMYFLKSDSIYMKVNRVAREVTFDQSGVFFGSGEDKVAIIDYSGIGRGSHDEICPFW
jgi:hypothetical protein